MVTAQFLQKIFILLPIAYQQAYNNRETTNNSSTTTEWSYDDIPAWGKINATCNNGTRQSPIALSRSSIIIAPLRPLNFINYDVPLSDELVFFNNGHTVEMEIPVTTNGNPAAVTGGILKGTYEPQNIHFHWGAPGVKGSEHTLNGQRYDVEAHIVHRNARYQTTAEALQHADGLMVLGILLKIVQNPDRVYPGYETIFNALPEVIEYDSETTIEGSITMGQLLGDLNTKMFYTYKGSLTTPPCAEAVTWIVFPQALPIPLTQIEKFWDIKDRNGSLLLRNYRPLQKRNGRPVYFRHLNPIDPIFFPYSDLYK